MWCLRFGQGTPSSWLQCRCGMPLHYTHPLYSLHKVVQVILHCLSLHLGPTISLKRLGPICEQKYLETRSGQWVCSVFLGCHCFRFLSVDRAKIPAHTHMLVKSYIYADNSNSSPTPQSSSLSSPCTIVLFSFFNSKIKLFPHLLKYTT